MPIVDNCGEVPTISVNPETGLAYNTTDEIVKLRNYLTCVVFNFDLDIGNLELSISDEIGALLGTVGEMISNAISESEARTDISINNAVDGLRNESQQADSLLQQEIDANQAQSDLVDTQLFNYSQALHNQQQGYIDQQDQNILQQAYGFTSSQVSQVYDYVSGEVSNIYSDLETAYQFIADIVEKIGKFIDDPLGWLLKFLTDVFIPWVLDEIAELVAPTVEALPPRSNYETLFNNAELI